MQKLDNDVVELTSIIEPRNSMVGDSKAQDEWQEIGVYIPDDPHLNKVSGVVALGRRGGKISDIRLDD